MKKRACAEIPNKGLFNRITLLLIELWHAIAVKCFFGALIALSIAFAVGHHRAEEAG